MRRGIIIASLLFWTSCEELLDLGKEGDTGDLTDTGTFTDSDADTDADTDSDADADTDTDAPLLRQTCGEAVAAGPWADGSYSGVFDGFTDDWGSTCGYYDGDHDGFFAVTVPAFGTVTVTMNILGNDANAFLVDDCTADAVCLDNDDDSLSDYAEEVANYNFSGTPQVWYGVLEGFYEQAPDQMWTVDIASVDWAPERLLVGADTCDDLASTPLITEGVFGIDLRNATNGHTVYNSDCTGFYSADSPDQMFEVVVPAGQTLTVDWFTPNTDGAVYLMNPCGDTKSGCLDGADDQDEYGSTETTTWSNDSGADRTIVVVADGFSASNVVDVGILTVDLQ